MRRVVCYYVFMRTTVVLPSELLRAAKSRSAERGESLKALLTRAVEAELGRPSLPTGIGPRVGLPLFGGSGPAVRRSNADLERVLADADAAGIGPATRRRRRREAR